MIGFEPQTSDVGSDRSTNLSSTLKYRKLFSEM